MACQPLIRLGLGLSLSGPEFISPGLNPSRQPNRNARLVLEQDIRALDVWIFLFHVLGQFNR